MFVEVKDFYLEIGVLKMGIIRINDEEIEIVDRSDKDKHLARLFIYIDLTNKVHIYTRHEDRVVHHSFMKGSLLDKNIKKQFWNHKDENPSRRY